MLRWSCGVTCVCFVAGRILHEDRQCAGRSECEAAANDEDSDASSVLSLRMNRTRQPCDVQGDECSDPIFGICCRNFCSDPTDPHLGGDMNHPAVRACTPYNFQGRTGGCFTDDHSLRPDTPSEEKYKEMWTAFGGDEPGIGAGYPNSNKAWRSGDSTQEDKSLQFPPAEDESSNYWVFHICDGSGTQAQDCGGQLLYVEHFGNKVNYDKVDVDGGAYGQFGWCQSRGWLDKNEDAQDDANWKCPLSEDECNGVPRFRSRTYCPPSDQGCGYDTDHQSCPGPYIGLSPAGKSYGSYRCGWWNTIEWDWWPALNSDPGGDYTRLWGLNKQFFFGTNPPTQGGRAGVSVGGTVLWTMAYMTFEWVCHGAGGGEDWSGLQDPSTGLGAMCFCDNEPKTYKPKDTDPSAAQDSYPPPGTEAYVMEYYSDTDACHVGYIDYFDDCIYVYKVDLQTGEFEGDQFEKDGETYTKESWVMFPFYRPEGEEAGGPW